MAGALSGVFMPPLCLLLGLTMGLALHVALLHLLANFPLVSSPHRRNRGRCALVYCFCWPLSLCGYRILSPNRYCGWGCYLISAPRL